VFAFLFPPFKLQIMRLFRSSLFVALLAVLFLQEATAQSPVRFGLTAVPVVAWHRSDNPEVESDGALPGFQYGLLVDYLIDDEGRYTFASGLLISGVGGKLLDQQPAAYSVQDKNRLQYIEIPLTFKLTATELNYFTFFGQIGVVPGVNIRARGDRDVTPDQIDVPDYENEKLPSVNALNFGLEVGGGIRYALGEHLGLSAGLFYRNGFVNVYEDNDGDKITLNHLALQVGLFF
jgi:hypothetical protein